MKPLHWNSVYGRAEDRADDRWEWEWEWEGGNEVEALSKTYCFKKL